MKYHFNVPAILIWISHILIGSYFFYLGYHLLIQSQYEKKSNLNYLNHGIILCVLGSLAFLYHLHIWLTKKSHKDHEH